jgi:hypothetical protein
VRLISPAPFSHLIPCIGSHDYHSLWYLIIYFRASLFLSSVSSSWISVACCLSVSGGCDSNTMLS